MMWMTSSQALLHRYGEKRMYVTDMQTDHRNQPAKVYVFLSEYGTETELVVEHIRTSRRIRSKDATLYVATILGNLTILLLVDYNRGNHYVYCKNDAYTRLTERLLKPAEGLLELAPAAETVALQPDDLRGKVMLVDTGILASCSQELEKWIKHNELILSPYYTYDLENYISDPERLEDVQQEILRLTRQYTDRIITHQYADVSSDKYAGRDMTNEKDYMLVLAQQIPVPHSQIVFVTAQEDWKMSIASHGFQVCTPAADYSGTPERQPAATVEESMPGTLPPRSHRHQLTSRSKTKKRFGFHFFS